MGSNPLFNGRKAPPHPPTAPHAIGPNTGNENADGAIADDAANVSLTTTDARVVS